MPFKKYPPIPGAAQPPYIDWNKIDPLPDTRGIEFQDDEECDEAADEVEEEHRCFAWPLSLARRILQRVTG